MDNKIFIKQNFKSRKQNNYGIKNKSGESQRIQYYTRLNFFIYLFIFYLFCL